MKKTLKAILLCVSAYVMVFGMMHNTYAQSPNDGFNPNANGIVKAIALQSDGKILIGGFFTTIGGTPRNYIARLNINGSLDTGFDPNVLGYVQSIAIQPDGKILVGGAFTTVGGVTRNCIARLNSDGSLDTDFNPNANDCIYSIAIQSDGKILVGGAFTNISSTTKLTRNRIARLNSDGSLDTGFDPNADGGSVWTVALQPDGKILVGGGFTTIGDDTRNCIARLNADGSLDTSFNPNASDDVFVTAIQPDGKIIIGGWFTTIGGVTRNYIARLNADGSLDTSFNPNASEDVYSIVMQADGKIIIGGNFIDVGGDTRNCIARLNTDGSLDGSFDPDADSSSCFTMILQSDGKILVGGAFTTVGGVTRNRIARLYPDGSVETNFDPNANNTVWSVALQPDGKTIIGGGFTTIGGVVRNYIARLNSNGSLDADFDPNANNCLYATALQPDGKIVIGGQFTTVGDVIRNRIARLNSNGSLDTTFNPNAGGDVTSIAIQSDGKIVIGGNFMTVGGITRNGIARLNSNGSLDTTFNPNADNGVNAIALQPDGKIIISGGFHNIGGVARDHIARLNSNGSLDTSFDLAVNGAVRSIAFQPDGKIVIGGVFTTVGGTPRNYIARLNSDGSLDTEFDPNANNEVYAVSVQTDGKIVIGGVFWTVGVITRNHIARLNSAGSLDTEFDPDASGVLYSIALQPDGKIIIAGEFTTVGGITRSHIARLTNTSAALQELTVTTDGDSTIQWIREETSPELSRVWFEKSFDGLTWTTLGNGVRIADGWELAGVGLPVDTNVYIRARGIVQGGFFNGSSSIIEFVKTVYLPPVLTEDDTVISINNGDMTTSKTAVTLTLAKSGATKMRFMMNTTTWTAWEAYNTTKTVTLPTGDGTKYVYVQFDNELSVVYYDTIILDMKAPSGTIVIDAGAYATLDLTVDLTLTAADDSDITHMCISPTATCPDATLTYNWEPFNTSKTFTIPGLATAYGIKTVYAKFKDKAGKISTAVSDTIMYVVPANLPPSTFTNNSTILIKGGAVYATTTAVPLTIKKPAGSTHMKFSNNGTTWTAWELCKTPRTYYLPAGDGKKVVYAKFKDTNGEFATLYGDDIILDTKPPVGTVLINNGAVTTNSRNVTLQLEATDINGIKEMQFLTSGTVWPSTWVPYATTANITLPAGDGTKKVSVKFKDNADNISAIIYDSIILDTTAPVGKVTINAGAATTATDLVTLTLSAPTAVFMLISVDGGVTWGDWEPFVLSKKVTLPAGAGLKTVCVLFSDYTGNVSNAADTITLTVPPAGINIIYDGTIVIKNGENYTTTASVTLTTINHGTNDYMQFSTNNTTWSAWESAKDTKTITLPTGDGIKYVLAKFKTGPTGIPTDAYGDTIILDTTAPTGAIVINANAAFTNISTVTVSVNATDANGVNEMNFSLNGITWLGWEPYATTKTLDLTGPDGVKKVSVKFKDNATKESAVIYDSITLDRVPPVGKVVINGGAANTSSDIVTLTLTATGATMMQISLDGGSSWGSWEPFVTSKKVTLTGGVGENIVQMKFRDLAGNESIVAEDRITYQP